MKKGLFYRAVAMLLAVVLLLNLNITALQVHAMEAAESGNAWTSSSGENLNSLPAYAKGGDGVDRQPDIGTSVSKSGEISSTDENKTTAAI